jgi:protease-4
MSASARQGRSRTGLILGLILGFGVLFMLGVLLIAVLALTPSSPQIREGSTLMLRVGNVLTEAPPADDPFLELFGNPPASLQTLRGLLTKAAVDDRIERVLVRIDPLAVGVGKVQELRDEVQRFRERSGGKPINAYLHVATNKEYYLASAFDEVWLAPEGLVLFNGLTFEVTFLAGTLGKVGVRAEFARVGEYKNAPEALTEEEMSEPYREVINSLADELFDQIVTGVAEAREVSVDTVRAWINDPPLTARGALELGMVDALMYRDQMVEKLKAEGDEGWRLVLPGDYGRVKAKSLGLESKGTIAVVFAEGQIATGKSSSNTMGSATMTRAIRQARKDDQVRALVLRVDSPGGSGLASDLIWRELLLTSEEMPVIVSMSDLAASGGYYISMGAERIFAQPATITGSIGVYAGKFDISGLYEKIGAKVETISRGPYARLFSSSKAFDEQERAKVEGFVESFYDSFVTKAADGRRKTWEEIDAVARGRVWTGRQALEKGLVDELGGLRDAFDHIKTETLGLTPDDTILLKIYPKKRSMLEELLDREDRGDVRRESLGALLGLVDRDLDRLVALGRAMDGSPTVRIPYDLRVH